MYNSKKRFLSVQEIARWFGVNPMTIYRKVQKGELPAIKFGKNWLFPEEAINDWITKKMFAKRPSVYPPNFKKLDSLLLVYLFGSVVQGNETPISDLDIAYLDDGSLAPFDFEMELESVIRGSYPAAKKIDILPLRGAPLVVKYKIIKTGKLLYSNNDEVRAKFEEEIISNYLDYELIIKKFYKEAA